ncbi:hypothetical protein [Marinifilum fragile]|uniref:hypothetical protein n=1 Tax=Marinifilum fragile TaxID=570161 RepID=UPI002AA62CD9|nr:hypothetical protein [Marinifilum fragile]
MKIFKVKSLCRAVGIVVLSAMCLACSQNEIIEDLDDARFNALMEKYNIQDVEESELENSIYKDLQPINSISQLDSAMKFINKYFMIPSSVSEENGKSNVSFLKSTKNYWFKESFPDGIQMVYLELDGKWAKTVNSSFYQTFLWDAIMTYQHEGDGGTEYRDGTINFVATGFIALKLVHNGLLLKKIPTVMEGYYNPGAKSGRFVTSPRK